MQKSSRLILATTATSHGLTSWTNQCATHLPLY